MYEFILILLLLLAMNIIFYSYEPFWEKGLTVYKCKLDAFSDAEKDILFQNRIQVTTDPNHSYDIFSPCGYTFADQELEKVAPTLKNKYVYAVPNMDQLVAKNNLWKNVSGYWGEHKASTILPHTFLKEDLNKFIIYAKQFPQKKWVLKKNIQQQKGIYLTKNSNEAIDKLKNSHGMHGYVIAQEYLEKPYLIRGRKINMRFYVLLVIKGNDLSTYIYKDGFVYYTKKNYSENLDPDCTVTTGYIDRSVYKENPLTLQDLSRYVSGRGTSWKKIIEIIQNKIKCCVKSIENKCVPKNSNGNTFFQILGCDVQPNSTFTDARILEFNKGPNLNTHDDRDGQLKRKMVADAFQLIGLERSNAWSLNRNGLNGFAKI